MFPPDLLGQEFKKGGKNGGKGGRLGNNIDVGVGEGGPDWICPFSRNYKYTLSNALDPDSCRSGYFSWLEL